MNALLFFEKRNNLFWIAIGSAFIILLGLMDYLTGYELSFSLFYLAPITLITWFKGKRSGLLVSCVSALAWFSADYLSGLRYPNPTFFAWNTLIRLGFFLIVTVLLAALKHAYDRNRAQARVDFVSGAVSVAYFYDLARTEIERSARYNKPFSFAYIDLDNFKRVNDSLGHSAGDKVLRSVTETVQRQIRQSDTFARLGGDEFGLLLPETEEEKAAGVISRLHSGLTETMRAHGWEITFSIGGVTFCRPPASVDEMVKLADGAMYSIKTNSKNGVAYQIYGE